MNPFYCPRCNATHYNTDCQQIIIADKDAEIARLKEELLAKDEWEEKNNLYLDKLQSSLSEARELLKDLHDYFTPTGDGIPGMERSRLKVMIDRTSAFLGKDEEHV